MGLASNREKTIQEENRKKVKRVTSKEDLIFAGSLLWFNCSTLYLCLHWVVCDLEKKNCKLFYLRFPRLICLKNFFYKTDKTVVSTIHMPKSELHSQRTFFFCNWIPKDFFLYSLFHGCNKEKWREEGGFSLKYESHKS